MQLQQKQDSNAITVCAPGSPFGTLRPTLYTVEQFPKAQPAFTSPALRNLVYRAEPRHSTRGTIPGNGLLECGAIVRIGRRVLIHEEKFLAWVERQNEVSK